MSDLSKVRFTDDEDNYVLINGHCFGWFVPVNVDRYMYFCHDANRTFQAHELRAIADKLDKLNTQSQTAKE